MRILLVEDDQRLAAALGAALRRVGYDVVHRDSGASARNETAYDVMLLDLGLPDCDGVEVCRQVRGRSNVPIIMLTARGAERDRINGLRSGADDYVVKPFSVAELEARIQAVLRRTRPAVVAQALVLGDVRVDLREHRVSRGERPVDLTPKEFALLARLALDAGAVVSRERLMMEIWHEMSTSTSRNLDVHMTTLRAKLGKPSPVRTVRGVGYCLMEKST